MALQTVTITMRKGDYKDFIPERMLPAEWAIVVSGDPSSVGGKAAYICFAAGDVKRIATYEDMVQQFGELTDDIISELESEIGMTIQLAQSATHYANTAGSYANAQGQVAEQAANNIDAIIDDLESRLESGEFIGPQGPQGVPGLDGEDGTNGVVTTMSGQYGFQIKDDGHLYLVYTDGDTPPDFQINENGHLILTIGG